MINSGAMVEGALRQMDAGNVTLNSDTTVTGHLWVPGTPQVLVNGGVTFGGTTEQGGSASPSHHQLTLNPGATLGGLFICNS